MTRAIELAKIGRKTKGGGAFGAVIVRDNTVVCEVHNLVKQHDDLTQHAELRAVQVACEKIGRANLKDCVLYTSCEPCMMCLGACHWAKFKSIYFGASAEDAKVHGYLYSDVYYMMNVKSRHQEFNMIQFMAKEALEVWK